MLVAASTLASHSAHSTVPALLQIQRAPILCVAGHFFLFFAIVSLQTHDMLMVVILAPIALEFLCLHLENTSCSSLQLNPPACGAAHVYVQIRYTPAHIYQRQHRVSGLCSRKPANHSFAHPASTCAALFKFYLPQRKSTNDG
jgi:hypothetical protein